MPFESLDFVYTPSADVAADIEHFAGLGAELVWAIERFGTRVAMLRLSEHEPAVLLAGHLGGERPVLVYRVPSIDRAAEDLRGRGWDPGPQLGFPYGPICSFHTPGGHRLAIYELTRPEMRETLAGRRDF